MCCVPISIIAIIITVLQCQTHEKCQMGPCVDKRNSDILELHLWQAFSAPEKKVGEESERAILMGDDDEPQSYL
ncbi:hypothetical protein BG004_004919 [Podila humilis]|nr:hypothetical protein BG004_004919 [Podila humilis]